MHEPIIVDVNSDGTVVNIAIPVDGNGTDSDSEAALAALRDEIVPATIGTLAGAEYGVTGYTASSRDFTDFMKSVAPLRVRVRAACSRSCCMLVAFRSIVIAAKAIVLNLLSVAAAYGVLVLVFQHGWGKDLLGFTSTAGIVPIMPIFLFVILFGLSMDYHVFILSRIRELYDRGACTDEAISQGIKQTAGVVTSAAIVMVAVFAVFATLAMMIFKQFGVGLAVAILIDATIVRAVLLPASMKLLGDSNWYLPQLARVASPPRARRHRRRACRRAARAGRWREVARSTGSTRARRGGLARIPPRRARSRRAGGTSSRGRARDPIRPPSRRSRRRCGRRGSPRPGSRRGRPRRRPGNARGRALRQVLHRVEPLLARIGVRVDAAELEQVVLDLLEDQRVDVGGGAVPVGILAGVERDQLDGEARPRRRGRGAPAPRSRAGLARVLELVDRKLVELAVVALGEELDEGLAVVVGREVLLRRPSS